MSSSLYQEHLIHRRCATRVSELENCDVMISSVQRSKRGPQAGGTVATGQRAHLKACIVGR